MEEIQEFLKGESIEIGVDDEFFIVDDDGLMIFLSCSKRDEITFLKGPEKDGTSIKLDPKKNGHFNIGFFSIDYVNCLSNPTLLPRGFSGDYSPDKYVLTLIDVREAIVNLGKSGGS